MSPDDQYTGPQAAPAEQFDAVVALSNRVFRSGSAGDMARQYPALFRRDRPEQLRILLHGGRPVCLVGMTLNDVTVLGCSLRVACIGSVGTDPAHRRRGLAGRALDDAVEQAVSAGASVMLISGGRGLYRRRGAFPVGLYHKHTLRPEELPEPAAGLELAEVTDETIPAALRLFEAEPIRFRRSVEEYAAVVASGWYLDRPGATYLARRDGEPAAVLSINTPQQSASGGPRTLALREAAGDRPAVLEALRRLARDLKAETVEIDAHRGDVAMREACRRIGSAPQAAAMARTTKLLNAEALWAAFSPLVAERVGPAAAEGLRVSAEADPLAIHGLTFQRGKDRVCIRGAHEIGAALFGSLELDPLAEAPGPLGETLRGALPLPLPLYGLSYI